MSIFITSFTDCVAFSIGSTSALPALSSFCAYAAIGIFCDFALQVTFFVAVMVLDARRRAKNRLDCCPCVTTTPEKGAYPDAEKPMPFKNLVDKYLGPALTGNVKVQFAVIAIFAAFFGLSIFGATELEQSFDLQNFATEGSFVYKYFDVVDQCYGGRQAPVVVVAPTLPASTTYLTPAVATAHSDLLAALRASPMVLSTQVSSWLESHDAWAATAAGTTVGGIIVAASPASASDFYAQVDVFLKDSAGERFRNDVVWTDAASPAAGIKASRFILFHDPNALTTSKKQVAAMRGLRDSVSSASGSVMAGAFPYNFSYIFFEQFAVIKEELFRNVALSLSAVFVVVALFIASPMTSGLVIICVAMAMIDLLGAMWLWGIDISDVAVINLVLAIGLSVDYVAHIGHAFMKVQGTRAERVTAALGSVGGGVLNGGVSTFLAVVVLAFAESFIFKIFFKQFFCIIVLGLAHGLILLPVLLTWVGPEPYALLADADEKSNDVEKGVQTGTAVSGETEPLKQTMELNETVPAPANGDADAAADAGSA
jgi:predicted RND superfamily exporter protein